MTIRPLLFLILAGVLVSGLSPAAVISTRPFPFNMEKLRFPVTKKILPNGLTVILHEDHTVPTISYQTWFRVGSKNEEAGFTGIAHLFEHMMFKGAKRYTGKEFDQILQANGVTNNAFTTYDYTGYYEDLSSTKLRLIIDLESDRIENLALTPQNLKSEKEVVKEERRFRVDNSIYGSMNEALWSTAFKVHPYSWPVVGWMKDIDAITLEKCKEFFRTNYSVSNAVIVIAGDFKSDEALKYIDEFYGRLPKVEVPRPPLPAEPSQNGERLAHIDKIAQSEQVVLGYHIGKEGDNDSYVMDLISNILTEGESSRLYKKLVYQEQKALGVQGSAMTPQNPGLFEIYVHLKSGVKAEPLLGEIYEELQRLSREKVNNEELEKAQNQIMSHWVDSMKTIHGKAYNLALNEVVTGNYENLFTDLEKYSKISREDIQRVAAKYFYKDNRTVVILKPAKEAGAPK